MGGKKKVTIGYKYYMGIHMGIGRGPIDELVEITADSKHVFKGSVKSSTSVSIRKSGLFGGDKAEGGIDGTLWTLFGEPDQTPPSRLVSMLKGDVPSFRVVATLFFDGQVSAMNPYIKPWKLRVRRILKGWSGGSAWYAAKANIQLRDGAIHAMNPAHIIYQCLTDPNWGGGIASSRIHDASFKAAADTLYNEGFGLCIRWSRQESVSDFIRRVIDHIGGSFYQSRFDGLLYLKLLRNDYDPESLPLFDEDTGLLSIEEDENVASSGAINEVVVTWVDPLSGGESRNARERNLAAIQADGQIISATLDYSGLPTADLAGRIAVRELAMRSSGLKRFKLKLDRRGWQLEPDTPFRIRSKRRGINNLVLRAGRIEDGTLDKGELTITAVQDVFGMPSTSMSTPQPPLWTPPDREAKPVTTAVVFERSWRDLAMTTDPANLDITPSSACYLAVAAQQPNTMHRDYQLQTRIGSSAWQEHETSSFTNTATLLIAIDSTTTVLQIDAWDEQFNELNVGDAVLLGSEILRVDGIDINTQQLTVGRGCVDTLPTHHATGSVLWFIDDSTAESNAEYAPSTTVQTRLITQTNEEQLNPNLAPVLTLQMRQRQARPYPPGRIRINNSVVPTAIEGDITLVWAHRDRLLQADQLIDHNMTSIGPEPGTTYTARLLRASNNSVLTTQTGITANTVTLATTYEGEVIVELWAVRDGLECWQKWQHKMMHTNPIEVP